MRAYQQTDRSRKCRLFGVCPRILVGWKYRRTPRTSLSVGVECVLWQSHESQPQPYTRLHARLPWLGPALAHHSSTAGRIWLNVTHHAEREETLADELREKNCVSVISSPFALPAINLHHSNLQTFPVIYFQTLFTLWKSFLAIRRFLIFFLPSPSSLISLLSLFLTVPLSIPSSLPFVYLIINA